ncbi:hypothetical protein SAMN02910298_02932 [Pseudobutyrivibrio sp. YE44]|uniref:hypothetical protein n=1 Tax=Pseudobutyrivibrio sp. YE44 TaxID=1520802 RepID=UPI0008903562|nr:hypothetical protein [Pseudobutyrivibrio sp. YE44]SDB56870.1 hypothetical protein SAMN02910298_02932 [Pseudobutyrivibrio sp. YE44]
MSEKSDLYDRINQCNAEIATIKTDIASMDGEITIGNMKLTSISSYKTDNENYDMSVGDTWRRQLCNMAIVKQKVANQTYSDSITSCEGLITDLQNCISNAWKMVRDLEDEIRRCQDRIAQIEAEEAEAARRAAEAAASAGA